MDYPDVVEPKNRAPFPKPIVREVFILEGIRSVIQSDN